MNRLPVVLSATALVVAVLGVTPVGQATSDAMQTHFARNASFLRGKAPSIKAGKNKIPAANKAGKLDKSWGVVGLRAAGSPGSPGSALAFAKVKSDGTVDASQSKNITSANVVRRGTSAYCFSNLSFNPKSVVATIAYGNAHNGSGGSETVQAEIHPTQATDCQAGERIEVATANTNPFAFEPAAFYVVFN